MSGAPTRGPNVPHRTSRTIAVDQGTDRGGFAEQGPEYDPVAGVPTEVAGGRATTAVPVGATPSSTPIPNPSPFSVGSK